MGKYFILAVSVMKDEFMTFLVPGENEEEARENAKSRLPEGWVVIFVQSTLAPQRFTRVSVGENLSEILPEIEVKDGEDQESPEVGS